MMGVVRGSSTFYHTQNGIRAVTNRSAVPRESINTSFLRFGRDVSDHQRAARDNFCPTKITCIGWYPSHTNNTTKSEELL